MFSAKTTVDTNVLISENAFMVSWNVVLIFYKSWFERRSIWYKLCLSVFSRRQTRSWTRQCFQLRTTLVVHFLIWPTSSFLLHCPPRWTLRTPWPSPRLAHPTAQAAWPPTSPTLASVLLATVIDAVRCRLGEVAPNTSHVSFLAL